MTESIEDQVKQLLERISDLRGKPPLLFDSDPRSLAGTDPYRRLVDLGRPVLELLLDRIHEGDMFLNDAVLEIAGMRRADMFPNSFPSEEEISAALIGLLAPVKWQLYWTAVTTVPATQPPIQNRNATVTHQQEPISVKGLCDLFGPSPLQLRELRG